MYKKSIIIWSASVVTVLFLFMPFYSAFASDTEFLEKMLKNYPEELLKAFGMSTGASLSTVLGYFSFIFIYVQICLAIQSANYGFHFLSVEEREMTADFLMSKPVSRSKIIISKFLAAFTAVTITNLFVWIGSFVSIAMFSAGKPYDVGNLVLILLSSVFFQLFFLSAGMVISMCLKKIRSVLAFSMALSIGMFVFNALNSVFNIKIFGFISPFYHFEPSYINANSKFNIPFTVVSIGVIVISLSASYILYQKRNVLSAA